MNQDLVGSRSNFDAHLHAWQDHQSTPWGRLFYSVARANLQRHLEPRPLHILDAGGGNGLDAIYLAAQGHTVALVDGSAEMLAEARLAAEECNVAERIAFYHSDVIAISALFPEPTFDVALCHNVVQYVDDAASALRAVCSPLRRDGLISFISVNRYSQAYREATLRLDPAAAYANLDATTATATLFDLPMRLYTVEDLSALLESVGCALVGRYGIRCVTDYISNNNIKSDPAFFAQLERLEHAMTDKYPYWLLARFFQIIARRC